MSKRSNFLDGHDNAHHENLRFVRNELEENLQQYFGGNNSGGAGAAPPRDSKLVTPMPVDEHELKQRKNFLLQLGLSRKEAYECAIQTFNERSFDLDSYKNKRHVMRLNGMRQSTVDSRLIREIRDVSSKRNRQDNTRFDIESPRGLNWNADLEARQTRVRRKSPPAFRNDFNRRTRSRSRSPYNYCARPLPHSPMRQYQTDQIGYRQEERCPSPNYSHSPTHSSRELYAHTQYMSELPSRAARSYSENRYRHEIISNPETQYEGGRDDNCYQHDNAWNTSNHPSRDGFGPRSRSPLNFHNHSNYLENELEASNSKWDRSYSPSPQRHSKSTFEDDNMKNCFNSQHQQLNDSFGLQREPEFRQQHPMHEHPSCYPSRSVPYNASQQRPFHIPAFDHTEQTSNSTRLTNNHNTFAESQKEQFRVGCSPHMNSEQVERNEVFQNIGNRSRSQQSNNSLYDQQNNNHHSQARQAHLTQQPNIESVQTKHKLSPQSKQKSKQENPNPFFSAMHPAVTSNTQRNSQHPRQGPSPPIKAAKIAIKACTSKKVSKSEFISTPKIKTASVAIYEGASTSAGKSVRLRGKQGQRMKKGIKLKLVKMTPEEKAERRAARKEGRRKQQAVVKYFKDLRAKDPHKFWSNWWNAFGWIEAVVSDVNEHEPAVQSKLVFNYNDSIPESRCQKAANKRFHTAYKELNAVLFRYGKAHKVTTPYTFVKNLLILEDEHLQKYLNIESTRLLKRVRKDTHSKRREDFFKCLILKWRKIFQQMQDTSEQDPEDKELFAERTFHYLVKWCFIEIRKFQENHMRGVELNSRAKEQQTN